MRGMTPVYTAVGQGTLWVGSMLLARNPRAMKANRIRVLMSCLGGDSKHDHTPDYGGVRQVEGIADLLHFWAFGLLGRS